MKTRISNCTKKLKKLNLDAILITDPNNIVYLTNFSANTGYLLLTQDGELVYFTNFLYKDAAKTIKNCKLLVSSNKHNIFTLISDEMKKLDLSILGFEAKNLPLLEYKTINSHLSALAIDFVETKDLVEEVRMIKERGEISAIKKSIQTSNQAFEFAKEIIHPLMSEKTLSIEIERFLRLKGDLEIAFPSIVASGTNTAFPHHLPGNKNLNNEVTLIDLGSKHYGYCADLTRVFFWGKMPTLLRRIYDIIRKAQSESIKKIRDGVKASEVDKIARQIIDKKGWGKYFGHGLGHGIGLCVHESPMIGPNCDQILKEGMIITIEPAIYLTNKFGIRLEEMVLVKKGKGEVLSGNFHR
ncbi:MAG: aminopeptidase P family protein [Candidatus Omnitrophica bacterium]|nr:aminopeptidase P family protein [Candidatus Omnitrophota bacterium]